MTVSKHILPAVWQRWYSQLWLGPGQRWHHALFPMSDSYNTVHQTTAYKMSSPMRKRVLVVYCCWGGGRGGGEGLSRHSIMSALSKVCGTCCKPFWKKYFVIVESCFCHCRNMAIFLTSSLVFVHTIMSALWSRVSQTVVKDLKHAFSFDGSTVPAWKP